MSGVDKQSTAGETQTAAQGCFTLVWVAGISIGAASILLYIARRFLGL